MAIDLNDKEVRILIEMQLAKKLDIEAEGWILGESGMEIIKGEDGGGLEEEA